MSLASCIYEGKVTHRRYRPMSHEFAYRVFLMYVDLDELPTLFDGHWLWSSRRPAPAWFRRSDYHVNPDRHSDPDQPLADSIRELVAARTGCRPEGPVRVLTHFRYFGYVFNPVTFYYVFDADGARVETVVAEITNTPWGERHAYVLPIAEGRSTDSGTRFELRKEFHVSPFMEMDHHYSWWFGSPGAQLGVFMKNRREGETVFDAHLDLERREIGTRSLARVLVRYPLMTARVSAAIYWQALRLRRKGAPFFSHPRKRETVTTRRS